MPTPSTSSPEKNAELSAAIGGLALFLTFSRISLSGFGGVMPFLYRAMVERTRMLTAAEMAEIIAIGQILPGPSVCNIAVIIGYRKGGVGGAVGAFAGMIFFPMFVILAMGIAYTQSADVPQVRHALAGMSAVAAGLLVATSLKMVRALPKKWSYLFFGALQFIGLVVLRWPLIATVLCFAPLAVWLAWRNDGK